jgi:hypothetical protein
MQVFTTSAGIRVMFRVLDGLVCEISQFWQFRQAKLQPAVATEKVFDCGMKWRSGFFSTGSTWTAQGFPYATEYNLLPKFTRLWQVLSSPGLRVHSLGQIPQSTPRGVTV